MYLCIYDLLPNRIEVFSHVFILYFRCYSFHASAYSELDLEL